MARVLYGLRDKYILQPPPPSDLSSSITSEHKSWEAGTTQDKPHSHYQGLDMQNGANELVVQFLLCIRNNPTTFFVTNNVS
jgi:hypothetical protein